MVTVASDELRPANRHGTVFIDFIKAMDNLGL
jgi:hypothetical protein